MSAHPVFDLWATDTNTPLGIAAKKVLDDLAAKDRLVWWLLALAVEQEKRSCSGGIPKPFTSSWRNQALPVTVHADYQGRGI